MQKATIWNPNDPNSKTVIDVGTAMPTGFKLWTGGTATGVQAQAAITKAALPTTNNISSSDIANGMNMSGVTPPPTTAGLIHQTFADNAQQYTQQQQDMFGILDKQRQDAQASIDALNKQGADIAAGKTANTANYANLTVAKPDMSYQDIQRQTVVDDLVNSGITDPNQLLTELNKTGNFTLDQINQNLQEHYNPTGFRQAMETAGNTKYQLDQKYQDYTANTNEINTLSNMYANELAKPQTPALASVMQGRLDNTKAEYAGRISVLQAANASIDGNITLARTYIDRGIEAVNADRNDRLNFLNFYQGLLEQKSSDNKSALLTATADEKKAITDEIGMLQSKIEETQANKDNIMKLLTDTQTAQIAIKAGVTITDTQEQAVTKMNKYIIANPTAIKAPTVTEQLNAIQAGYKIDANGNLVAAPTAPTSTGIVTDPTGNSYDISSYASDPNHEAAVKSILANMPQMTSAAQIDAYIQKVAPGSPVTGQMIINASGGKVSWETMMALMQQDSNFGTKGAATKSFNPGNVGNTEIATSTGNLVNKGSWQGGVDAVAQWLNNHKVVTDSSTDYYSEFKSTLQPQGSAYFNTLSDQDKGNVMQVVNGDALSSDIAKGMGGAKYAQTLLQMAQKVDPNYSENTNKIRYAFNQQWSTDSVKGSVGSRNAINTALGHLATLKKESEALPGTPNLYVNQVGNLVSKNFFGKESVTDFTITLDALGSELARVYKGGVPESNEIKEWKQNLAANFSKGQFNGVANTTAELLSSKLTSLRYLYKSTMGKEFNQTLIDPDKRQALIDAGINPDVIVKENTGVSQDNDQYPTGAIVNVGGKNYKSLGGGQFEEIK